MPKREPKSKWSWLKNWWHDWAAIDLTLLPAGIALAYFLKSTFANGFWFNLSTELIGAYISIRFIDYLLKKTESRHSQRRGLARDINWFANRANDLIPYFDENLLGSMKREIKNFDERWASKDERNKFLYEDEIVEVNKIRESRNKIVRLADSYIDYYKILRKIEVEIINLETMKPKWLANLQDSFYLYRTTRVDAKSAIRQPLLQASDEIFDLIDAPSEEIVTTELLKSYVQVTETLIEKRDELEKEIQTHIDMDFNLQYNIYQESG